MSSRRRGSLQNIALFALCLIVTVTVSPLRAQAAGQPTTQRQTTQQIQTAAGQQPVQQVQPETGRQSPHLVQTAAGQQPAQQVQPEPAQSPHLIQTVTDQDVYEGMLALGLAETPVLEAADCGSAYKNVKSCVVRIQMGNAHGSGVIWKLTPDTVVIATNKHVLEYWKDAESYVYFQQGRYLDAGVLGVSAQYDVGFVAVDRSQFTYEELMRLNSARAAKEIYDGLRQGDAMFSVDAGSETEEARFHEGTVEDIHRYIEDFDAWMLYCHGFAREGMSGGGTFDGRGYLIGMTTGGTLENEVACVPLADIMAAYEEVVQEAEMND